jgi:hypothetical protein
MYEEAAAMPVAKTFTSSFRHPLLKIIFSKIKNETPPQGLHRGI